VVPEEDHSASAAGRSLGEKRIARISRCGFDRDLSPLCQRAHVRCAELKIEPIFARKSFYKASIGIAGSAPQSMIQMTNHQALVAHVKQPVQ
jgi:hypothetical protein